MRREVEGGVGNLNILEGVFNWALRVAGERSLVEARRAQALAPGEPRWAGAVAQIEQERPEGP